MTAWTTFLVFSERDFFVLKCAFLSKFNRFQIWVWHTKRRLWAITNFHIFTFYKVPDYFINPSHLNIHRSKVFAIFRCIGKHWVNFFIIMQNLLFKKDWPWVRHPQSRPKQGCIKIFETSVLYCVVNSLSLIMISTFPLFICSFTKQYSL